MRTRRSQSSGNPVPRTTAYEGHRSVLLQEAVDSLDIRPEDTVVDATLGGAGHAKEIVKLLGESGAFIGFDADEDAIKRGEIALSGSRAKVLFAHVNFRHMKHELSKLGIARVDKALFDLGWSGFQLTAGRGFSFLSDEPLSMAYSKDQPLTAAVIVNEWSEESIADVIYGWGEERFARRIASAVVAARMEKRIETARELADIVKAAVPAPARYGRLHPATKTFQALRIAVNDELGALEEGLRAAWQLLNPGGRIAVITFHSIEDRIVKQRFADLEKKGEGKRLTKKPIAPSDTEREENPRARSAKLRVIEKIS